MSDTPSTNPEGTPPLAGSSVPRDRPPKKPIHPVRRAILRGLAIVMPPLLTIVLFIWAWTMIDGYVLRPIETGLNFVIRKVIKDVPEGIPEDVKLSDVLVNKDGATVPLTTFLPAPAPRSDIPRQVRSMGAQFMLLRRSGNAYAAVGQNQWVPIHVYERVEKKPGELDLDRASADAIYRRYVELEYLPRWRVIPVFLVLFVGVLYFLGKFVALGIGRFAWSSVEGIIFRLPVVRNVYSSVKQVTDFVFSEQEVQFTRVVAVQYPRKGIWSLGFVTGESMLDIRSAANEPILSVLMPTSPMPATGFTINVRRSETIDLDLTIDEAIQFIVSCGVVVPPHQLSRQLPSPDERSASDERLTTVPTRDNDE